MKVVDVKSNAYIDSIKKINNKDPKLKILMILLEYQNIKIFLQKVTLQIGLNKFLSLKKLLFKIVCCGHMLLTILREKKLFVRIMKTHCKKQIKKNLELKKQSKEKVISYMLNGKDTTIKKQ